MTRRFEVMSIIEYASNEDMEVIDRNFIEFETKITTISYQKIALFFAYQTIGTIWLLL